MTRPTSELDWFGNELDPLGIGAQWVGSGWDYVLYWGHLNDDGTQAQTYMSAFAGAALHRYPAPGTYSLVARSLINDSQMSDKVTVRGEQSPAATVDDLGGGRVRLNLKAWPSNVLYRVSWNLGGASENFTDTQLAPEHQYPAGVTKPIITVIDVPARRAQVLLPTLTPPPPRTGVHLAWHPTRFWYDGNINWVAGSIRGTAAPGTRVTARLYASDPDIHATADAEGHLRFPDVEWVAGSPEFYPPFRWAKAWLPDQPDTPEMWVPVYTRPDEQQDVIPVYTWKLDDPMLITLGVTNPVAGTYQVGWGDGSPVEAVVCDGWVLHTQHRYSSGERRVITVTDPNGKTGTRVIAAPTFHQPWCSGFTGAVRDTRMGTAIQRNDGDWFTPCLIHWQDNRWVGPTSPTTPKGDQNAIYAWYKKMDETGRWIDVTHYGPLTDPVTHRAWVPDHWEICSGPPKTKRLRDRDANPEPPTQPLRARWSQTTTGDRGYSGEFTIANPGPKRAMAWRVAFRLPTTAVIADVWPTTAQLRPLGDGFYAIASTANLAPDQSTTVGIRVEHAGDPPLQPTEIRCTATQTEGDHDPMAPQSHAPALVAGGYINPGAPAKLIVLHVPAFVQEVRLQSPAFATTDWVTATVTGTGPDRIATAEVQIGADVQPDTYECLGDLGHGFRPTWQLLVEPANDGTAVATVTRVDAEGLMRLKVEGLSRNLSRGLSGNAATVDAATEMAEGGADDWFGLVYDRATASAANNFVLSRKAQPGKTYEVKIRQVFSGGHVEFLSAQVAVPHEPSQPAGQAFHVIHKINLDDTGIGDVVEFKVPFGPNRDQPDLNYHAAVSLKPAGTRGRDPKKLTDAEAEALSRLNNPVSVAYGIDHIVIYARNPHELRGKPGFSLKYRVLITPVEDSSAAGASDDED